MDAKETDVKKKLAPSIYTQIDELRSELNRLSWLIAFQWAVIALILANA